MNLNKSLKTKLLPGFSIIEIIIYLAIFTTMSIIVINSFITILSSFSAIRTNQDLLEGGSVSMDRISHEIRQAKNIDIVNSTSEILQLNSTDTSGNSAVIKLAKVGNALNLYEDGNLVGNLLPQNILLNSISFDRISTTNSEGIKIKIVLQDSRSKIGKTENFYNTIILRGGY
jgi:hypothetical protein